MTYDEINLISNYLYLSDDKSLYQIINNIFLNNTDVLEFKCKIIKDRNVSFVNQSTNDTLDFNSLIFCKFTKENIFECLFNINQHFYNYKIGENIYNNYSLLTEFNKLGFNFQDFDCQNKQINKNNEILNNHDGMHFFANFPIKLIVSNFVAFGETLILAINDPQLISKPKMSIINPNDLKFKNIYVKEIFKSTDPLFIKELFKYCSINKVYFKKLLRTKNNNKNNIFDVLIDNFRKIEYAESNLNLILNCKTIEDLIEKINSNYENFQCIKYNNTITFLSNAKEIYLDLLNKNNIFPIAEFVSKLDEICPGELHIFDEKYQIEQFRETYGGKEFKENFLNNLSKTAEDLSDKEIKKLFLHKKGFIRKTKQEEICDIILNYNKKNKTKQIPILMLVNNFKKLDKNNLEKLEQIINEYINGNTECLYDYLVREEKLDLIIEKINPKLDQIIKNNTNEEKQQEQISISIDKAR